MREILPYAEEKKIAIPAFNIDTMEITQAILETVEEENCPAIIAVGQAAIKDGKLAFSNLYLGRYYLVERATGIVIPVDSNGQYYLSGKYPLLNKKLEPTGSYAASPAMAQNTSTMSTATNILLLPRVAP